MATIQDCFLNLRNDFKTWGTNNFRLKANKSNLTASDGATFRFTVNSNGEYGYIVIKNGTEIFYPFKELYPIGSNSVFEYTGTVQEFIAPVTGTYQLEVYGAQGGNYNYNGSSGGKGGYSKGNIMLSKGDILYVVVGGKGTSGTTNEGIASGGYNGGGNSYENPNDDYHRAYAGGGGATHIAKVTGILSSLSNNKSAVIIVAGGGGGVGEGPQNGGAGGGTTGEDGIPNSVFTCTGGTQTAGGTPSHDYTCDSGFGQGGNANASSGGMVGAGGGGGGYYGGGSQYYCGGAGGSGYIGGVTDGVTLTGKRAGNGKAKITYIAQADTIKVTYIIEGKTYTEDKAVGTSCLTPISFTAPNKSGYVFYGWSYTQDGDTLKSCIAGSDNITLYGIYGPYVYDVTYTRESIAWEPSITENINNSTYINSAETIYGTVRGPGPDSPLATWGNGNTYDSGTITILNLTSEAKNNFKYAEVNIEYVRWCDGGGYSHIYVDGTSIADTTKEVVHLTYTWDLSEKTSCTARIDTHNWSDNIYYWSGGFIGVKSVTLHN